ncbi:hypothetical protein QT238_13900 [Geobacillus stearothermophilus]|nr:hypothetical protein QT238_13900 [Geobacillus stearothermophilus]
MSYPFLLLLDTDKIKDYVFASSKLKEIRGASMLLHYLNTNVSRKIIYRTLGLPEDFNQDENERFRIIYLDGGSGKVEFLDKDDAIRCGQAIADAYARWTKTASLSWVVTRIDPDDYYRSVAEGEFKLRLKKQSALSNGQSNHLGLFHRCSHNEMEIVEKIDQDFYEMKHIEEEYRKMTNLRGEKFAKIGPSSVIKRTFYEWYKKEYENISIISKIRHSYENVPFEFPKQLSVIGQAAGNGHIGLIYMDGNSMNKVLRSLRTTDEYCHFSRRLNEAIEDALVETIMEIYPPDQLPELVNADEEEEQEKVEKTKVIPVELVMAAGDDLIVIVPSIKAMEFASLFLEKFAHHTSRLVEHQQECLTMSAGIAIAKSSFPIKYLVPFAEQLLKSAKKKNYELKFKGETGWEKLSTLDYMVVSMSSNPDLQTIRREQLMKTTEDRIHYGSGRIHYELTVRPFHLEEWKQIQEIIETLKTDEVPFPNTKIKLLYHVHFMEEWEGEYYFCKCYANLRESHKKALKDLYRIYSNDVFQSHWYKKSDDTYASPFIDFLEIYPFIEGKRRDRNANLHREEEALC